MGRHPDRRTIDVARQYRPMQPFRGGDRQDAAAGADVARAAEAPAPRQSVQRQQNASGRGVLAGAERGRGVDLDRNRAGRRRASPMRAVEEKPPNAQRREGAAVLRQPVALRQSLLGDADQPAAGRRRRQREPHLQRRAEHRPARIGLDAPQRRHRIRLERADRAGQRVERRRDGERGIGAGDFRNDPHQAGHRRTASV